MSTDSSAAREVETFTIKGPAGALSARLETPPAPSRRAVVGHPHPLYGGTMDNAVVRATARKLVAAGAAVLTFDFRSVRESEGSFDDGNGEQLDLLAAEAELERRFPGLPHWLAGYSFGAYVVWTRLDRSDAAGPDAVLAIAPPLTFRVHAPPPTAPPPIALITGELDGLTPTTSVHDFTARLPTLVAHEIVRGAGHDLGTAGSPGPDALDAALDRVLQALRAQAPSP